MLLVLLAIVGSAWIASELNDVDTTSSNEPAKLWNSDGIIPDNQVSSGGDLTLYDSNGVLTKTLFDRTWECGRMNNPVTSWDSNNPNAPSPTFISSLPIAVNGASVLINYGIGEDGIGNPPYLEIKGPEIKWIDSINDSAWTFQANGTLVCDEAVH